MKTRHQLLILFSSALILLLVTAYLLLSTISNKNRTLLEEGQKDLTKETNKVISLISLSVENWVFDNTYWDDIVTAFKNQDTTWVEDNYSATMGKYGANYLWLLNTDGSVFFNSVPKSEQLQGSFFMDISPLMDSLRRKPFRH
ncbi:MAG TPA: CHASE4 domain-containing protein, partial [Chitinophagaceae bacterium]|nr:CHASE4 domain-containing protein [Chitinophagaceae bacterium]